MQPPNLSNSGLLDFFRGLVLPFRAIGVVFSTSRLTLLTLAVTGVTACCLIGLGVLLWYAAPALVDSVCSPPQNAWVVFHYLAVAVVYLLLFVLGANVLPMILTSPLMDFISVETERLLGVPATQEENGSFFKGITKSLANTTLHVLALALGHLVLLIFLLIPIAGGVIWTALSWCWTILWLAASYLDVPMARHFYLFRQEVRILKKRLLLCMGFGTAIFLILWIPFLNCIFVPVSVVAGTLLFRGLVYANILDPPRHENLVAPPNVQVE